MELIQQQLNYGLDFAELQTEIIYPLPHNDGYLQVKICFDPFSHSINIVTCQPIVGLYNISIWNVHDMTKGLARKSWRKHSVRVKEHIMTLLAKNTAKMFIPTCLITYVAYSGPAKNEWVLWISFGHEKWQLLHIFSLGVSYFTGLLLELLNRRHMSCLHWEAADGRTFQHGERHRLTCPWCA
jgi:hypothetical protein